MINLDAIKSLLEAAEAFNNLNDENEGWPTIEPDIELEWSITPETKDIPDEIKELVLKALFMI